MLFYGVQVAHAKLQPQDIHAGIGPYYCTPGACQLTPFCASPPERAEKQRLEANRVEIKIGRICMTTDVLCSIVQTNLDTI